MRIWVLGFVALIWAAGALAQQASGGPLDCDAQAALVKQAVTDRDAGVSLEDTKTGLHAALGEEAGAMLAEWIYSLPEGTSAGDVAAAWKTQCAAL
ncbi:MAG: hypothetical protein QNJ09_06315 [Paracoccaceae bacterium]|nr:hypothetical protein [Paracoccaceae bacterium]